MPEKEPAPSRRHSGARKAGVPAVLVTLTSSPENWSLMPKSAICAHIAKLAGQYECTSTVHCTSTVSMGPLAEGITAGTGAAP